MAYPTVADVRQYLPQIKDSTPELTALTAALPRAIKIVERAIGQLLGVEGFTFDPTPADSIKYFDRNYMNSPWLPPIQGTVTLVEYESGFNQWTIIDPSNYVLRNGVISFRDAYVYTHLRITAPWSYGDCPDDIAEIMLQVCVSIWRSKDTGGMVPQVGESGSSYLKTVASLNPQQKAILQAYADQYRQVPV